MIRVTLLLLAAVFTNATEWHDCDPVSDIKDGPYAPAQFFNITWNDTIFYGYTPTPVASLRQFPLFTFMHGSTGEWAMYSDILAHYTSHGFIVIFPHIKSPEQDKHPLTTNTNGEYLLKAVDFAKAANADSTSPLYQIVDEQNIIFAGHSMGATCSIMASKRAGAGVAKLTVTQHPGICGPFGPPPSPDTWMQNDLKEVSKDHPVLFTTATNDSAFWPKPLTAKHEMGCFNGALDDTSTAIFAQFSADACNDDGDRQPNWPDGGHNCPMKQKDGGRPENVWVLTAAKLYTHMDGAADSKCYEMMWGNTADSLQKSTDIEEFILSHNTEAEAFIQ